MEELLIQALHQASGAFIAHLNVFLLGFFILLVVLPLSFYFEYTNQT